MLSSYLVLKKVVHAGACGEATEEELFDTSPTLFSKFLIRRCHIVYSKENWLSAKQLQNPC